MAAEIINPRQLNFAEKRMIARKLLREGYTAEDLTYRLAAQMARDPHEAGATPLDQQAYRKLIDSPDVPDLVKRVLTSSATALVRQDLDPTLS